MRKPQKPVWKYEQNERLWLSYVRRLKLRDRSDQTVLNYFKSINRLDKRVLFLEATRLDMEEFFLGELTRLSNASVRNYHTSCRLFFSWMVSEGHIDRSPVDGVEVPDSDTKAPEIVSDDYLKALLKTCDRSFLGKRDSAIIRLFSEPGSPRLGEMHGLEVTDVNWRNCVVQVTGKTGSRLVPYSNKTADALERYLTARSKHKHSESEHLWLCVNGRLGYYSFRAMLFRRCQEAGITPCHPHDLRHKAADVAMSAGISDLDMQTLFGWSSPQMLAVYAKSNRTHRAIESAKRLALGDRL